MLQPWESSRSRWKRQRCTAFATARRVPVACVAHVTNTMGQHGGDDFEKGEDDGTVTALRVIKAAAAAFAARSAAISKA